MLKQNKPINFDALTPSWFIYTEPDGTPICVVHNDPYDELEFFVKVARCIAFSDYIEKQVEKIYFKGKEVVYAGWQHGMTFEFKDLDGNTVWKESFPHWDH